MEQYIDKSALVAELEKRITEGEEIVKEIPSSAILGMIQAYQNTLSIIKNLQSKVFWKSADGDLPEIDKEVIVLTQPYPLESAEYVISFAHRPNPDGWYGKSISTGKIEHYQPKTYDKGGWNMPNIKWWLDLDLPVLEEE